MSIGAHFGDEVIAAGLGGLPFAWNPDGEFFGRENLSPAQNAQLDALILAHDPNNVPVKIPASVSSAQAKIALARNGLYDQVKTIVAAYPLEVQLWFSDAGVWERYNPYVMGIGIELGLTEAQIDNLFVQASLIV